MTLKRWIEDNQIPFRISTTRGKYQLLMQYLKEQAVKEEMLPQTGRKLYYISMEFLMGRLLTNNLINLGLYDEVAQTLSEYGVSVNDLEDQETEPSLANGGLGRLAACYMDSAATLGLNACGISLMYHEGLFRQGFENRKQVSGPDPWDEQWLRPTALEQSVCFSTGILPARMYELDVVGGGGNCRKLRLFERTGDQIPEAKDLNQRLYPDDSTDHGRRLRIYQEYFLCSNAAQLIIREAKRAGSNLRDLDSYAAVQINDTHPAMVIPELVRLLTQKGIPLEVAAATVTRTCAYTNHTILAEALEVWHWDQLNAVVPHLMSVIAMLQGLVQKRTSNKDLWLVDEKGYVHMARMAAHFSSHVNGVSQLHSDILTQTQMKGLHELYPGKFCNVTNGISFRRWLHQCNPGLTRLISDSVGPEFKENPGFLERLMSNYWDEDLLRKLLAVKRENKVRLSDWLQKHQGESFDPDSILMVQAKRFHEYKRQQMNCLWIIHQYLQIKDGRLPKKPITVIFGGKAAVSYERAKQVIHLALCLSELIRKDPQASPWLKVIVVRNYNVTAAEKLIPAADVSEQISLASKEASGTGNMKFMLNGALTIGTLDGANVEIGQAVGQENIYIFGATSDAVQKYGKDDPYRPWEHYDRHYRLRRVVDFLVSPELKAVGDPWILEDLRNYLTGSDPFMTCLDFIDYVQTKERLLADYEDEMEWARKMLVNIAHAGFFSSDRSIGEYNRTIWFLGQGTGEENKLRWRDLDIFPISK